MVIISANKITEQLVSSQSGASILLRNSINTLHSIPESWKGKAVQILQGSLTLLLFQIIISDSHFMDTTCLYVAEL